MLLAALGEDADKDDNDSDAHEARRQRRSEAACSRSSSCSSSSSSPSSSASASACTTASSSSRRGSAPWGDGMTGQGYSGAINMRSRGRQSGVTALHVAATQGSVSATMALLHAGANPLGVAPSDDGAAPPGAPPTPATLASRCALPDVSEAIVTYQRRTAAWNARSALIRLR